jgi:hypothetical protein
MENTKRNNQHANDSKNRKLRRQRKAQKQRELASQANLTSESPNLSTHKTFLKTFLIKAISLVISIVKMFDEIIDEINIPNLNFLKMITLIMMKNCK